MWFYSSVISPITSAAVSFDAKFTLNVCVHAQSLSRVLFFATLWTVVGQAPLFMGFFRQNYWSGLPLLPPGDLPNPATDSMSPVSPALQADYLPAEPLGKTLYLK